MEHQTNISAKCGKLPSGVFIPPKPDLLEALHVEFKKTDINLNAIADLISHDVAMAAEILKIVNSAYFSLPNKVISISHAIALLGVDPAINLSTGFLLRQALEDKGLRFPRFWDESVAIAEMCAFTTKQLGFAHSDRAYTLGLFHNVGIPLLAQCYSDFMTTLSAENNNTDGFFTDIEDQNYGTNHAIIAAVITCEWGLSNTTRNVILNHHDPESIILDDNSEIEEKFLMAVLKVAEHGVNLFRNEKPDPEWDRFKTCILEYLKISETEINDITEKFMQTRS